MPRVKKQAPKTKEQLLSELRSNSEFIVKMKFIKEEFYPALLAASTSIDDAQQLLTGFNTAIMQEFLALMKETKMSDMGLASKLDAMNPLLTESVALLNLFKDMTIFEAKEHIENMRNEVETFLLDEKRTRTLADLPTKWLDEI